MMRFVVADFTLVKAEHHYRVRFESDDDGQLRQIVIDRDDVAVEWIDNSTYRYRPCVTHAKYLVANLIARSTAKPEGKPRFGRRIGQGHSAPALKLADTAEVP